MALHEFKRIELETILKNVLNRPLGDVDVKNVFNRTITHPKITGIAGDVVEQSILGYPADSDKNPDLLVDGIPTELKTTGIRNPKSKVNLFTKQRSQCQLLQYHQIKLQVRNLTPLVFGEN